MPGMDAERGECPRDCPDCNPGAAGDEFLTALALVEAELAEDAACRRYHRGELGTGELRTAYRAVHEGRRALLDHGDMRTVAVLLAGLLTVVLDHPDRFSGPAAAWVAAERLRHQGR